MSFEMGTTHRFRVVSLVSIGAVVVLLIAGEARSQVSRNAQPQVRPAGAQEVGTYQLFKAANAGQDELYRINTKTGQVWLYAEYAILSSDDVDPKVPGLDKVIEQAAKEKESVYTLPYWDLTPETRPSRFRIH
jgi:hypothetical protein